MIGRLNRVYEVLNRTRPLTLKMIWRLHVGLGIPAESLIKQSRWARAACPYVRAAVPRRASLRSGTRDHLRVGPRTQGP